MRNSKVRINIVTALIVYMAVILSGCQPREPIEPVTTVMVVRHAERANDSLNDDGLERADKLAHVTLKAGVTAICVTKYKVPSKRPSLWLMS